MHWIYFLRALPLTDPDVDAVRLLGRLDAAYRFTDSDNNEVLAEWLVLTATHDYRGADARTERFLTTVGRRKYLTPIYEALLRTAAGQQRARDIYVKARPAYHPITRRSLDALLGHTPAPAATPTADE